MSCNLVNNITNSVTPDGGLLSYLEEKCYISESLMELVIIWPVSTHGVL